MQRRILVGALLALLVLLTFFATNPVDRLDANSFTNTCSDGLSISNGRVIGASHHEAMGGFAALAETTGGLGERHFEVSSTQDFALETSPGTLRHAVETANRVGGGYITFASELIGQTISLQRPLRLSSRTSIDGGCVQPRLKGPKTGSTIYIDNAKNVIVSRISITQQASRSAISDKGDCITIRQGSDQIWIGYALLSECRDGLLDITSTDPNKIVRATISHSRFTNHDKVMLIDGHRIKKDEQCSDWFPEPKLQVTLFRNHFSGTAQRHPRVSGSAFVHMYENYIAFKPVARTEALSGAYGSLASDRAAMLVESTRYVPPAEKRSYRIIASTTDGVGLPADCRKDGQVETKNIYVAGHGLIDARQGKQALNAPYSLSTTLPSAKNSKFEYELFAITGPNGWQSH